MWNRIQVVLLLYVGTFTGACSSTDGLHLLKDSRESNILYISGVPFFSQEANQCGPASLAAVMNYWGKEITPDEIASAIYSPQLNGTLSLDMWQYAQDHQFQADIRKGSIEALKQHLAKRLPIIAFLNLGFDWWPVGHFVVVVGLDPKEREVITYNGKTLS